MTVDSKPVFKACCPKFASGKATGAPDATESCIAAYGFVDTVNGGYFCNKDKTVRADVIAACTVAAAATTPITVTALEYISKTDPTKKCPKPGFECFGTNYSTYCDSATDLPKDASIDAACENKPATLVTTCKANPANNKFWV